MKRFFSFPSSSRAGGSTPAGIGTTRDGHGLNGKASRPFRELFENLPIACLSFNARGEILDWNPAAEELYGWTKEQACGQTLWETIVREEDHLLMRGQIERAFVGETLVANEWQHVGADGRTCLVSSNTFPITDDEDRVVAVVSAAIDISARKRAEERLERHAFHDRLTGLPDRTLFLERVQAALRRTRQSEEFEFAVLFINLDRFKIANESLGHGGGDHVLISTARKLEACAGPGDTVARLGGDEFALLLTEIKSEDEVLQVVERIQKRMTLPLNINGQEFFLSASIGIVLSRASHARAEDVLRDAHAATDRAKAGGKGRYEIFDKGMPSRAHSMLQLESDLRRALARNELRMEYQPIVSLSTGLIDGFESLVRWTHPERGAVSPGQFIPLAEETGLIIPIGFWALRESCAQLSRWQKGQRVRSLPLTVSVNLSPVQFALPNLVDQIKQTIKRTEVDSAYLKLEITESSIMDNTEAAIEMVAQLKAIGIKISLDDFGTGYSSLSYLHRFPFNTLKIDQSFVSRMDSSEKHSEIVRAIIALGHSLNMDVIAEGVENHTQLAQLRALKCHYGQGYFFAAGMDAATAQELVMANPQW
jgi:diguanylate cyclase (GGDEF)-like protein/PAS domain S-box-containing protein